MKKLILKITYKLHTLFEDKDTIVDLQMQYIQQLQNQLLSMNQMMSSMISSMIEINNEIRLQLDSSKTK